MPSPWALPIVVTMGADIGQPPGHSAFLHDFADVDCPLHVVLERFRGDCTWLDPLADAALRDGHAIRSRIDAASPAGETIRVSVRLGPWRRYGEARTASLQWATRTTSAAVLLDGDLEVATLGPARSRLGLHAYYREPTSDPSWSPSLLQRVAESVVRAFLRQVADTVTCDG